MRGRPLRKPLIVGALLFPLMALAALEAVRMGELELASGCFLAMGCAGLVLNVASLPMILRLAPPAQSSEALSLTFASWGAASICGGVLSSVLQGVGSLELGGVRWVFDEHTTLLMLTLAGFGAPFLYAGLPDPVPAETSKRHWLHVHREDFPVLLRAQPRLSNGVGAVFRLCLGELCVGLFDGLGGARAAAAHGVARGDSWCAIRSGGPVADNGSN
jgi:MFS family permease